MGYLWFRWNTCEIHGLMVIALKSNLRGGEFKTGRGKVKLGGVLDIYGACFASLPVSILFICLFLFSFPSFFIHSLFQSVFLFSFHSLSFISFQSVFLSFFSLSSDVFGINSETFRKPLDFTPGRVGPTNAWRVGSWLHRHGHSNHSHRPVARGAKIPYYRPKHYTAPQRHQVVMRLRIQRTTWRWRVQSCRLLSR